MWDPYICVAHPLHVDAPPGWKSGENSRRWTCWRSCALNRPGDPQRKAAGPASKPLTGDERLILAINSQAAPQIRPRSGPDTQIFELTVPVLEPPLACTPSATSPRQSWTLPRRALWKYEANPDIIESANSTLVSSLGWA